MLVLRPANVGLRTYHGKVIGPAEWPAILKQDDYNRLQALLAAPERHKVRDGSRKRLLTYGIGQCGVCGGVLRFATKRFKGRKSLPTYLCDEKGCVARDQEKVDELVAAVVIQRLSRPDAAEVFAEDTTGAQEARERAGAIRARLDTAARDYADGALDGQQLRIITAKLRPELEQAEAEMQRYRRPAVPAAADGLLQADKAEAVWRELPVTAKRSVMQALGLTVVILPREKRGPGFEPESVRFDGL
jgi:hypothetical protein